MSQHKFKLGPLTIDAQAYGSQGNAILGIRDSGKSYTATEIAEKLFEAGVPFVTFDPTGVWPWLQVPGKARGYPIVVAGGKRGNLPLTVTGAIEIVRAAMKNGVSLVIDLTDPNLSKADWKRIVKSCVRVLLQENAQHGLRHIFIEEAAEFAPQRVLDGDVYAEVEKLARIGGNSRLGYTLINQRSQEVNKAVVELCENLFLHRQKGANAITSLDHWLDVAGVAQKEIVQSLPRLPTGHCWAWMGGDDKPTLIQVPPKNSFHPDRRTMHGAKGKRGRKAVDVGGFINDMKAALVVIEAEDAANNPVKLRAELAGLKAEKAKLERQMAEAVAKKVVADPAAFEEAEKRGFERGVRTTLNEAQKTVKETQVAFFKQLRETLAPVDAFLAKAEQAARARPGLKGAIKFEPAPVPLSVPTVAPRSPSPAKPAIPKAVARQPEDDGFLSGPQRQMLQSLRWWKAMGHDAPSRVQVATICGWRVTSGHIKNIAGSLKTRGLIGYPTQGTIALTPDGEAVAPDPSTGTSLLESVRAVMTGPQRQAFDVLPPDGSPLSREDLANAVGWNITSGHVKNVLGSMRSLEVIDYPQQGAVARAEWLVAA